MIIFNCVGGNGAGSLVGYFDPVEFLRRDFGASFDVLSGDNNDGVFIFLPPRRPPSSAKIKMLTLAI